MFPQVNLDDTHLVQRKPMHSRSVYIRNAAWSIKMFKKRLNPCLPAVLHIFILRGDILKSFSITCLLKAKEQISALMPNDTL